MTIIFRRSLTPLERQACDQTGCIMPASWSLKEGPVEVFLCTRHDLAVRTECRQLGELVLDVQYEADMRRSA